MERSTRVSVYESDKPSEIQLVKSKLDDAQITNQLKTTILHLPQRLQQHR
jgi:hypothetical protein